MGAQGLAQPLEKSLVVRQGLDADTMQRQYFDAPRHPGTVPAKIGILRSSFGGLLNGLMGFLPTEAPSGGKGAG